MSSLAGVSGVQPLVCRPPGHVTCSGKSAFRRVDALNSRRRSVASARASPLSGSCAIRMSCDLRFCSPNAEFAIQDVKWGFHPCVRAALRAAEAAHPGQRLQLWFQDETRGGNKGHVCHRWWLMGQCTPGQCDRGYQWAYIFIAVRPATGEDFTLVLPRNRLTSTREQFRGAGLRPRCGSHRVGPKRTGSLCKPRIMRPGFHRRTAASASSSRFGSVRANVTNATSPSSRASAAPMQ